MAKKAVLVGCNYPGTQVELHGCVNDVWRLHRCLVQRFGFQERHITVLVDTDGRFQKPTGANINRALRSLVSHARPGDVLVFHFSGHGTRLPPETGAPDDTGYDECIVPCDLNLLTDDDFREMVELIPEGAILTLVSDSCHSGGLVKNAKEQIGESTHHGKIAGKTDSSLMDLLSDCIHVALEDRGIHLPSSVHGAHHHLTQQHRILSQHHHRHMQEDPMYQQVMYSGPGHVKSRALPLSVLLELLRQKSGRAQAVDVGTIRATLFDIFGQDASSKVKKFVKVLVQAMDNGGGGSAIGAIAQHFLEQKLSSLGNSAPAYLKPALEVHLAGGHHQQEVYAGSKIASQDQDRCVLISGCQSFETSADANPSGNPLQAYGAMSNAIQTILAQHPKPLSNHELVSRARQLLKSQGFSQHPGLYCSDAYSNFFFICS